MNLRKVLITGLLLSFALAVYQIWFQPAYIGYLESQGQTIGVAETAMGYFMAWLVTMLITYIVTKRLSGRTES